METDLFVIIVGWAVATLRSATPLMLVTLGETLTQRTGVINLGIEGEFLMGACVGFAVAVSTGNPWLGLIGGALASCLLSLVHATLVLWAGANQIASGLAVWILALGGTSYFGRGLVGQQVSSLPGLGIAGNASIGQLSLAGPIAIALVLLAAWWLRNTRTGLTWRVVGESASVAAENGIRPKWIRVQGILLGAFLAGLGGAVLSVDYTQTWANAMTKGNGLVAVGLVIVARWRPTLVLPVCLLFGFTEVAVLRLQSAGTEYSAHWLGTLPYLVVLFVLIATHFMFNRNSGMPADLRAVFS